MNTTNGMQLSLTKGVIFLNDDITIEFEQALLTLSDKKETTVKFKLDTKAVTEAVEEIKQQTAKIIKIKKNKTAAAVKEPKPKKIKTTSSSKGFTGVSAINKMVCEFLAKKGPSHISVILENIQKTFPEYGYEKFRNVLYFGNKNSFIKKLGNGTYELSAPIKEIQKQEDLVLQLKESKSAETETTFQKYPTGDNVYAGDQVKMLSGGAVTEDDILEFDDELSEMFASVIQCDEGSNMITIKINRTGQETLVYPHWVKLVMRKDK